MQYATCRSLAKRIEKFMAKQNSFDLPAYEADKLNDMVAAMIEQLEEVEDLWSEVTKTAREHGPDDPRDGTLLKDWANVVSIKRVVDETLAKIDRYTFPDPSPGDHDEDLSYVYNDSDLTSTDNATEDELDNSEDGSTHERTDVLTAGTPRCQACDTPGVQHVPQECPAYNRCCRSCGRKGHLGRTCPISSKPDEIITSHPYDHAPPRPNRTRTDKESREDNGTATPTDTASASSPATNNQFRYPESHESQDSAINQTRRATYTEMERIIKFMNVRNDTRISRKNISVLGSMEASLLTRWENVLNVANDKEGKATIDDQRLTAVLGMAIGHTRRLCARFTEEAVEALGADRHTDNKPNHATKLELACLKTWIHKETPQVAD